MTLNFTPTAFTAGTTMSSSTFNSNFTAMQPQSVTFSGTWVARNNINVGLTASDYTYSPLSINVIRLAPPLTCPDRGIVLSALKSGAVSDRLGMNAISGKLMSGALRNANAESYVTHRFVSGIGPGTFDLATMSPDMRISGFMLNMGTTAASGGSAAAIGYAASFAATTLESSSSIINVYIGAGVPWICAMWGG